MSSPLPLTITAIDLAFPAPYSRRTSEFPSKFPSYRVESGRIIWNLALFVVPYSRRTSEATSELDHLLLSEWLIQSLVFSADSRYIKNLGYFHFRCYPGREVQIWV